MIDIKTKFYPKNRILILIALLMLGFNLQAQQDSGDAFLWRLDSDLNNQVYLAGTLPMDNSDSIDIPKSLQQVFDDVELIVFDKSPADLKAEYQRLFAENGFYPADEMLEEHLDSELYNQLKKRLKELNSHLGHMPRMKPWLITISLLNLETEEAGYSRIALKDYYYNQAEEEEKEILLLDAMLSEQSLLSGLSEEAQIEYLQHCLKNSKKNIRQKSKLFKAWKKGNFKRFSSLVEKRKRKLPLAIQEIQTEIQQSIQVDQIIKITNSGKNAIIFIDAEHLVGKDSLLKKLQKEEVVISKL